MLVKNSFITETRDFLFKDQNRLYFIIFIFFFFIRLSFSCFKGIHNNYSLQSDAHDLIGFADKAVNLDFNFDYGRFITSPLFPVVAALHKIIFGSHWAIALVIFQITLSSLSGVYLFKLTELLLNNQKVSLLAAFIYGIFPLTFWYVHTFSQETLFQCLFIFAVYYLIKSAKELSLKPLITGSVLFAFAFLTKSHILLFSIFIPVIFYCYSRSIKKTVKFSFIIGSVCLCLALPYGIYHKIHNNTFVLSANGSGILFYLGNSNAGYINVFDVPEKGSPDYFKMKDMTNTAGYFNGNQARYDSIMHLAAAEKQGLFVKEAFAWMKTNPLKLLQLKTNDVLYFLLPGVSYRHYSFKDWLFSFICSFPVYLFGYIGMWVSIRKDFRMHIFILVLFLTMLIFSVVFYVQNRFRTITLEPFLIIYAAFGIYHSVKKLKKPKQERIH